MPTKTPISTAPIALPPDAIERIRFSGEAHFAEILLNLLDLPVHTPPTHLDANRIRRLLMARSLLLSEGMAPTVHQAARRCAERFGITTPIEIFQSAGAENAAIHQVESPVLLEIQGKLLALLDDDALTCAVGHELGHYLAHGQGNPHAAAARQVAPLLHHGIAADEQLIAAERLSMAMELTADRFSLIATGDLNAALRLEMSVVTGLAADTLTWDTEAYLTQSRTLMEESLARGEEVLGHSHPEHGLRTYALWLFSESDLFQHLTGGGPGTRPIAEVDATLEQLLGTVSVDPGDAALSDEPPSEMHECALAACVLVAAADGEIHDNELATIERVFAPLVDGWRRFLDPDEALRQFQQLGPLITAAGPRIQRSLFTLLAHVLAVDGEAHPAEVATVLAIGGALGCRELYRSLLPPVVVHFGLDPESVLETQARAIPMPARSGEAQAALGVFLQGIAQRGGGSATLRRLLRLLGEHRPSTAHLETIATALRTAQLTATPEPADDLDCPLRLELSAQAAAARKALDHTTVPRGEGSTAERLQRGLSRLRDKLISGDGRSPSIRLHAPRTGRSVDLALLEGVSEGQAERTVALLRGGQSARLVDRLEADQHDGARRAAREVIALDREHRSRQEESGANDLFLGHPFLTGLANRYLVRGPLLLYPVVIERQERSITLVPRKEEPPLANQSLLRLLFARKGIRYGDELAEQLDELAAQGPEALLDELQRQGVQCIPMDRELGPLRDRREEFEALRDDRLEVEECAVLGLFPQSSSDLLQDYGELLDDLAKGTPADQLLACAGELLPAELRDQRPPPPPSEPERKPVPVVYADPSQRKVLHQARQSRALVVDGPPGTGKSQVIVNLVADALARGERVAVVCEKRAALDVVANRLDGVGLRHLLAVVHDVQEDRRALYRQVTTRLEERTERTTPTDALNRRVTEATELYRSLRERTRTLARHHGELSLGELHTYAAGLPRTTPKGEDGLAGLDLDTLEQLARSFGELAADADLWTPDALCTRTDSTGSRHPFGGFQPADIDRLTRQLTLATAAARQLEQCCTALDVPAEATTYPRFEAARQGLDTVQRSRAIREDEAGAECFATLLRHAQDDDEPAPAIEAAEAAWQQGGDAALEHDLPVRFPHTPEVEDALNHIAARNAAIDALLTTDPTPRDGQQTAAQLRELLRYGDLWAPHSPWLPPTAATARPLLDELDATAVDEIHQTLERIAALTARIESDFTALGITLSAERLERIERAKAGLTVIDQSRAARIDPWTREAFLTLLDPGPERSSRRARLSDADAAWRTNEAALTLHRTPVLFPRPEELNATLDQLERRATSPLRWLSPGWWKARKQLRTTLQAHWAERAATPIEPSLLQQVRGRMGAAAAWDALKEALDHLGNPLPLPSDATAARETLRRLNEIDSHADALIGHRVALDAADLWPTTETLDDGDRKAERLLTTLMEKERLDDHTRRLSPHFPWLDAISRPEATATLPTAWRRDAARLIEADRQRREALRTTLDIDALLRTLATRHSTELTAWRLAEEALQQTLHTHWPEHEGEPLAPPLVEAITRRSAAGRVWTTLEALERFAGDAQPRPDHAADAREWQRRIHAAWGHAHALLESRAALEAIAAWPDPSSGSSLALWDLHIDRCRALLDAKQAEEEALRPLRPLFSWLPAHPLRTTLDTLAREWRDHAPRLVQSEQRLAGATARYPNAEALLRHHAAILPRGDTEAWSDTVRREWAVASILRAEANDERIRHHLDAGGGPQELDEGRRLGTVLGEHADLSVEALLARQDRHPLLTAPLPEKGRRRTAEQAAREAMLKEAKKRRNILHLRSFARRFGEQGLLDLLPVWLLSPETIAVLFPRRPLFDLVIIDEASQCTVENGLPVLLRGQRAVIAGDERQMPPTNFFRASRDDEEGAGDDQAREMFDAESLLVLARNRADHIGLGWHYRCLYEELIAFSNHAIYGGTLNTIPAVTSRTAPPALRWIDIPDGRYEDGANPVEAARVVDTLHTLLERGDRPTVGVVTFNLAQRRAIFDEIDTRRSADAAFAATYDEAMAREQVDERPFVKNLESVQGDERDVILFSLGHAPVERTLRNGQTERYVPARFGPLGQKGGERRLNVAVSRAKREIVILASFDPKLLSVARAKNDGPKLFKQFLEYAHNLAHGQIKQAERVLDLSRGGPLATPTRTQRKSPAGYLPLKVQLTLALEERGHRCEMDVGTSSFRIPVAIIDPRTPERYRIGILCDEGEYPHDPLESHVHIPTVLQARQWNFIKVQGREWERNRNGVLERIEACLI
ncbi:AAA domain-containing protein [Endothiovibrio diazotrophicus]